MTSAIPVIGMGAVSAAGENVEQNFLSVVEGRDTLERLSLFDARMKISPLCAQITRLDYKEEFQPGNRTLHLARLACREALLSMGDYSGLRLGIVLATTVGGITRSERFYEALRAHPEVASLAPKELLMHEPTALTGALCREFGGVGMHTLSTACSTGLHAIGIAKALIENETYDICLAVGADALSLLTVRGFASLTLLDPEGCRPFDKHRAGISLGEGAGAMLLASEKVVRERRGDAVGYVSGWGATADCFHMTAPHSEGEGARNALIHALKEAQLAPEQIDLIATHGTGTPDNDKSEIRAMKSVFSTLPPFCSLKRTLGHTLAASGVLESVLVVRALQDSCVPPTGGFKIEDEEIGASPSIRTKKPLLHSVKNSFGFGGNNAVVIFSREPQQ